MPCCLPWPGRAVPPSLRCRRCQRRTPPMASTSTRLDTRHGTKPFFRECRAYAARIEATSADAANKLPGLEAGNMTYSSYLLHFPIQRNRPGFCEHRGADPAVRRQVFRDLFPDYVAGVVPHLSLFRGTCAKSRSCFFLRRRAAAPETALGITK